MTEPEDHELVARVVAGDRGAFRPLVDRHGSRVFGLCLALLRHRQDAEDAAQDAFLKAFRAIHRFDPRFPFPAWMLKIATNVCRDRMRRRRREPVPLEAAGMAEPAAAPAEEADPREADRLLCLVGQAVEALEPDYRAVFHLYHREQRSYADIAVILDRPMGTVKTQLHRARRRVCSLVENLKDAPETDLGVPAGEPQ